MHPHQAKHRLGAELPVVFARRGHGDLGAFVVEGLGQALRQIQREQRRVARHRQQVGRFTALQPRQEAGQWPGVVAQRVGPDRRAEGFIGREVAVGVDHQVADQPALLHLQPQQGLQRQGRAVEILQALVHAPHAGAAAAGEHEGGDLSRLYGIHGGTRSGVVGCS